MIMFVLALIGSLLPLAVVATLFGLILALPWHSLLKAPSFAGIVAIIIAVSTGIWQDSRQRKERRDRNRESTERMLQEKAEQYCLAARNLIARYEESLTMLSVVKEELFLNASQRLIDEANIILLLEGFQLAFLKDTIGNIGIEIRELSKGFADFGKLMKPYIGTDVASLIQNGVLNPYFEDLRRLVDQKRAVITKVIERIPNLDLYKLYTEWRKKHPIE